MNDEERIFSRQGIRQTLTDMGNTIYYTSTSTSSGSYQWVDYQQWGYKPTNWNVHYEDPITTKNNRLSKVLERITIL